MLVASTRVARAVLAVATLAALASAPPARGAALGPVAVRLVMGVAGTGSALFAGNAYAGQRALCCEIELLRHKGGNPIHNLCADRIGPNDNPGMDARVNGKAFDAVTDGAVLWQRQRGAIHEHELRSHLPRRRWRLLGPTSSRSVPRTVRRATAHDATSTRGILT